MNAIVAIVGRPNVGKSTLFNRLAGGNLAIVDDEAGVTRDRHYADTHLHGRELTLVDTGGFDPLSDDPLGRSIARQVQVAIDEADLIVCVFDGTMPPTQTDEEAVNLLRRSGKPVIYSANKVDSEHQASLAQELYRLGVPQLTLVSALHGRGTAQLEQQIAAQLPEHATEQPTFEAAPRVALLGRPNAGKSSLFNRLAESERSLVDERPGTTRDPIDSLIEYHGERFFFVDTAGIRRKSKVARGIESVSVIRSLRAVGRAQIVVLMCDLSQGLAEQDARLLGLCIERRRALIVACNKLDLVEPRDRRGALDKARQVLHFARWAPIVPLSVKTGEGVPELMRSVRIAYEQYLRRISTGELNRFFEKVLLEHPPPTSGGRAPRIFYITQAKTEPPVFVAITNAPSNIRESYKRFVVNQIRKNFGFGSVPLYVHYKKRAQRER